MALLNVPEVSYTPSDTKVPTPQNYLGGDDFDFTNQYLPDTDKIIYNKYGNQEITGLLAYQGKESAFAADNFKWTEEGRLTQLATGVTRSGNVFTLNNHSFRANETITARDAAGAAERTGLIQSTTTNTFTVLCFQAADWTAIGTSALVAYVNGSQFQKGSEGMQESMNSQVSFYENTPTIIKEMVKENGSNQTGLTWLQVSSSAGTGFVWYYKNYNDTEKRFKNKLESTLLEGAIAETSSSALGAGYQGTQGLIPAMKEGNIFGGPLSTLNDVDEIIERLNKQGMVSQNYLYNTISQGAAISDFLKQEMVTALSWGAFDNDENMALKLDFKGFHRSGYEFYKSACRYLDDPLGQGSKVGAVKIHGLLIPTGSKQVYDKTNSTAASMPVLHVKYRANAKINRKYEMSVQSFEAGTTSIDETRTQFLSERMLVLVGRNNTMLFQG